MPKNRNEFKKQMTGWRKGCFPLRRPMTSFASQNVSAQA